MIESYTKSQLRIEILQSTLKITNAQLRILDSKANAITLFSLRKKNQNRSFRYRSEMNRGIRKQLIRNEWSVRLVSNRFRLFLGRWSFEDLYFKIMFEVECMLVNHRIKMSGTPPVPLERMLEHLDLYNNGELHSDE